MPHDKIKTINKINVPRWGGFFFCDRDDIMKSQNKTGGKGPMEKQKNVYRGNEIGVSKHRGGGHARDQPIQGGKSQNVPKKTPSLSIAE
ncbi:MAG: hypothetical protein ACI3YK_01710 [Eubacteriales bacterium]